jgi:serine/threonine-protein kinase HipA
LKFQHVEQLAVFYAPHPERRVKVGRLARVRGRVLFEFDAAFRAAQLELSPFKLPLRPGVIEGDRQLFSGLAGVFDDSLPDGWGRLLMDRRAAKLGVSAGALTPLDRLAIVGERGMGALIYEPETTLDEHAVVKLAQLAEETQKVLRGVKSVELERLIALGGSPQGAWPKVLVQLSQSGEVLFGARTLLQSHTAWLVKFRSKTDAPDSARVEHAYFLMAKAAGLDVPRTQLLGGFFAIERFDRLGPQRRHMHTLGGLLHLPHGHAALDYRDLLSTTRRLTRNEAAVREMFRRACFNVFAHNRDDHSRNFAFLMNEKGEWRPSPAYDLTYSDGPGGEHTLLVAGEGQTPGVAQLRQLGKDAELKRAEQIIDEVRAAVAKFTRFADEARVPAATSRRIARALRG